MPTRFRHGTSVHSASDSVARPSPRRPWARWVGLGLLGLAPLIAPSPIDAQVRLPSMGEAAAEDLPAGLERRYGDQIMREVWRDPAYLDDPVLQEYLQSLWQPLLEAARRRGDIDDGLWGQFAWTVFLVQDRSVNAFALPGGFVGVHLGLIAMTASSNELASVLAHELSHVTQRHIARGVANSSRQSMAGLAAMILGALAASRAGNAEMAQAAITGSQAAVMQGQLNFSRDMEREADRIGFGIFRDAGFSPAGMASMFEKMDQASRLNDNGSFPYLRSHPLTVERMSEARTRATMSDAPRTQPEATHALMQARARVLMDRSAEGLRRLMAADPLDAAMPGDLYGAAMAATHLKEFGLADRYLEELRRHPATAQQRQGGLRGLLDQLQVESLLARGDAARAAGVLAASSLPASRATLLLKAQASLDVRVPAGSVPVNLAELEQDLRTWVADRPGDAAAWAQLAQLSDRQGHRLRALRARAEARAAVGDLPAAIDLLRGAQRSRQLSTPAEFADLSVIDSRLKSFEERWRTVAPRHGDQPRD
jgi:beta-barrel assembly-enhancing protease